MGQDVIAGSQLCCEGVMGHLGLSSEVRDDL